MSALDRDASLADDAVESEANPPTATATAAAKLSFVARLHQIVRGQPNDSTMPTRGETALRAAVSGGLSGVAVVAAAWAITGLHPNFTECPPIAVGL